jgi:hypothetical protein
MFNLAFHETTAAKINKRPKNKARATPKITLLFTRAFTKPPPLIKGEA